MMDTVLDFAPMHLRNGNVIRKDDGEVFIIWPDGRRELLRGKGSLCGLETVWATSIDDRFTDCCAWHDHAYEFRAFFENHGWYREDIDDYFLDLMLYTCESEPNIFVRFGAEVWAREYHFFVRTFGGLVYYKHPAGDLPKHGPHYGPDDNRVPLHHLMRAIWTSGNDPWGRRIPKRLDAHWWHREREYAKNAPKKVAPVLPIPSLAQKAAADLEAANPRNFIVAYLNKDENIVLSSDADRFTTQIGILERAQFLLQMNHDGHIGEKSE